MTHSNYYLNELNSANIANFLISYNFSVVSFNIRSAAKIQKLNDFKNKIFLLPKPPDVIVIQETWYCQDLLSLYNLDGYDAVHSCRLDNHGGLSVYVNKKSVYKVEENILENNMHFIAISLQMDFTVPGAFRRSHL